MKKTNSKETSKKAFTIGALFLLCVAILAGTYFLTREPEHDFEPAPTVTDASTDTWEEQLETDVTAPTITESDSTQVIGDSSDDTQSIIEETETSTVTNLSDSTKKSESADEKPVEKPVITEDTSNPEKQPEYTEDVPQVSEPKAEQSAPPSTSADKPSENSGQVYDPVFGWIDTGSTHQDTVDSSGSINKQIGSMN